MPIILEKTVVRQEKKFYHQRFTRKLFPKPNHPYLPPPLKLIKWLAVIVDTIALALYQLSVNTILTIARYVER